MVEGQLERPLKNSKGVALVSVSTANVTIMIGNGQIHWPDFYTNKPALTRV